MRVANDNAQVLRLDAGESLWFKRQFEFIDQQMYDTLFPDLQSKDIVPIVTGVPDWAAAYFYRQYTKVGHAKIIGSNADDLPRVDVTGTETGQVIKDVGDSFGYTIKELKRAAATNMSLDAERASAARYAIEFEIDRILATGDADHKLYGLLSLDTIGSITPIVATTKTGGGTNWSAAAKPDEIAGDIFKLLEQTRAKLLSSGGRQFMKFRVRMPEANYMRLVQRRLGDGSDALILDLVNKSPYVESVGIWWRCGGAAANGTDDRMVAFPPDPIVVAGIVPTWFDRQEPEKRNLQYIVDCTGSTGGVVPRYPVAIGYMDAIDVA